MLVRSPRLVSTLTPRTALRRRLAACLAPAALLAAGATPASAYVFETYFGNPLHWLDQVPATPGVIDIYYDFRNIGFYTNQATTEQKSIYQLALSDWSAVTSGKLNFIHSTTQDSSTILNLGVGDLMAVSSSHTSAAGGTLGVARPTFYEDGVIANAAVYLDFQEPWDNTLWNGNPSGPSSPDFYSVALHEIGHALGLDHENAPFSNIMAASFRGEKLGPSADDILGMSTLYNATPNYTAISRSLPTFNIAYPPGTAYFNYFTGNPSIISYWTDSGITTIAGTTQVQDAGEFHQNGGTWTTSSLVVGGSFTTGLAEISNGTFTTTTATVNIGTLSLTGGTFQARTLDFAPGTSFNWTGGTLSLQPGATQPTLSGVPNLIVPANGVLKTAGGHVFSSLTVNGKAQLLQNGTATTVTRVNDLAIAGSFNAWSGQLDITSNALILQAAGNKAATLATLRNQIEQGKAGGTWSGNGITSSTLPASPTHGLALVDNADLHLTSFRGISGLTDDAVFLTTARNGDANIDAKVDAFDLNLLAAHWQQSNAVWSGGDFTGDGKVDAFDLNVLAANWQFGAGGSFVAALAEFPQFATFVAAVPEPASLAFASLALPLLLRRPRRAAR